MNLAKTLRFFLLLSGISFLSLIALNAQNITPYLEQDAKNLGLSKDDIKDWVVTDHYTDSDINVEHIYHRQRYNEIEVYAATGGIHLMANGDVLISDNKYVKDLQSKVASNLTPGLTAIEAITAAAFQLNYNIKDPFTIIESSNGPSQQALISTGGISRVEIPVKLMLYAKSDEELVLVWDFSIYELDQQNWWSIRVDAFTGEILDKLNWVVSCSLDDISNPNHNHNSNCMHSKPQFEKTESAENMMVGAYNVFPMPVESPNYGLRLLVLNPDNANASPFGWHDINGVAGAEFTVTRGNNVHAYEDGNNPGFNPDGGGGLLFDFPLDLTYSNGIQSEPAVITNLFYWNNIIHDVVYQYGFHEAGGNFQENNYGKGGVGSDYVNAEAQDNSGTCNANFGTPPDGQNPTMQMYICNTRDGDLDNGVIIHEYGHGISNRLTGGPANVNCLNNQEQMGEGWSDWYGIMLTMKPTDLGPNPRPIGTWLFGQGPNGAGIRAYPYSTNLAVNPHTYNSIKTAVAPHGVGSVWCAMLWEVTWALIDQYGFSTDFYNGTAGNNKAFALITHAMKLQPCSPGFVDGRNAILAADMALYGGANQCLIWTAFAKRGLGYSAIQGSTNNKNDGTEAFDLPPSCLMVGCDIAITNVAVTHLTCFNSNNGTLTVTATTTHPPINYSITGPVNASNATGVFINLLPGLYTIVVTDAVGATCTASTTRTINQGVDVTPPVITCPPNTSVSCASLVPAPNVALVVATDNCGGVVTKTFVGDVITNQTCPNRYTVSRTYRATDASGNSSTCIQLITVNDQTPPVINCPPSASVSCTNSIPPSTDGINATDNCGGAVTIVFVNDEISNQSCPNKYNVIRTYRATDVCGNSATCAQTISINDVTPPVISGVPANTTIECTTPVPPVPAVTGVDNCGGAVEITFKETNNKSQWPQLCGYYNYNITRTWTAKDACGNTSSKSQLITIKDTQAPTFISVPPAFLTVECDDDNSNNVDPVPVDGCDNTPAMILDIVYDFNPNGCVNSYVATYTWTAGDNCGNTVQYVQVLTVEDNVAPEMNCPGNITLTSAVPIPVSWVAPTADDHCDGPVNVIQTTGPKSGSLFQPNSNTLITYTATDDCGNVKTCSFKITIKGAGGVNSSKVSGNLLTPKAGLINNTEIQISGDLSQKLMSQGKYEFGSIPNGSDITIAPKKTTNPLEGVNTLDLILITNHILGKKALDSPFKILAADVNNSGSLSTSDLVEMRKLILHITDEFKDVDSWEFLPGDLEFADAHNPWKSQISSTIEFESIQADQLANFKGIKMGDVTWDATGKAVNSNLEIKENLYFTLNAENKSFIEGEVVDVLVSAKDLKNINGLQFTMNFDKESLDYLGVKSERTEINSSNFGLRYLDNGKITGSIDLIESDNESLFRLSFKAKKAGELSKALALNSILTNAEAYTKYDNTIGLNLEFTFDGKPIVTQAVLYQNEPNPFENNTVIRFYLPETQESSISIYNLEGKLVKEIESVYPKGENKITLEKDDFISSGVYYYQLKTKDFNDTKKMIFVK